MIDNQEQAEHLTQTLNEIIEKSPNSIAAGVAKNALGHDSIEGYFTDLLSHGCISGMVSELTYYRDTHRFFDRHYDEIETIRDSVAEMGIELEWPSGDLKNHLAWLAYEETAKDIAFNQLELEI